MGKGVYQDEGDLISKFLLKSVHFREAFYTCSAPGAPEIKDHEPALQVGKTKGRGRIIIQVSDGYPGHQVAYPEWLNTGLLAKGKQRQQKYNCKYFHVKIILIKCIVLSCTN